MERRVCIIGLDCLTPELALGEHAADLPALSGLAASGLSGPLESCVPPITVPAWQVMMTGLDPGVLGCYGFRDRADRGYRARRLASSLSIGAPALWTHVGRAGGVSRLVTVPQTHPPRPIRGFVVSDQPTSGEGPATYPPELAAEVLAAAGGELADVADHRRLGLEALRQAVHASTARRFRLARAWAREDDWTLLVLVDMGPDRMHHAFWRYQARDHRAYEPGHPFEHAIRDYYVALDREVGSLVRELRDDDIVLVVSDHGARTMLGGIALNQWLVDAGYLVLRARPAAPTPFDALAVDWARTRAWADGGYVGRVYLNVRGREAEGIVPPESAGALAHELAERLRGLPGPAGERLDTRVYEPRAVYRELRGIAPDLVVYFDDLAYRAIGSIGHATPYVSENDTGRDDANHARHGLVVLRDGRGKRAAPADASLYDVAPTVLERLGLAVPPQLPGRALP